MEETQFGGLSLPRPQAGGVDAVAFGEALVAFIAADGCPLRSAAMYRRTVVGAEFNVAAGLARLGHHVQFAGRVGDDPLGQVVEEACRAHGIEGHLTRDAGSFTGVLVRDMQTSRPTIVGYARSGSAGRPSRASPKINRSERRYSSSRIGAPSVLTYNSTIRRLIKAETLVSWVTSGPSPHFSHARGCWLVLAAPTGFRTLPIHPVLAAARKPADTTMPYAIIPQPYEKCGRDGHAEAGRGW